MIAQLLLGVLLAGPPPAPCAAVPLPGGLRAPPGLCVEVAVPGPGAGHVSLLVALPADPARRGLFVYRVQGRNLVPRFLGSGFPGRALTGLAADGDALRVETDRGPLGCVLQDFPLVCEELPE